MCHWFLSTDSTKQPAVQDTALLKDQSVDNIDSLQCKVLTFPSGVHAQDKIDFWVTKCKQE